VVRVNPADQGRATGTNCRGTGATADPRSHETDQREELDKIDGIGCFSDRLIYETHIKYARS